MAFTLPPLPYAYDALEPHISAQIMTLHHTKHHQTYINVLNATLASQSTASNKNDVVTQIHLQNNLNFSAGGHINHTLFWENLVPASSPSAQVSSAPKLTAALTARWGSVSAFQEKFTTVLLGLKGSGWGWLVQDTESGILEIVTSRDQDIVPAGKKPLLGVDMWEHAYYLQYLNDKAGYAKGIWNIVNWKKVEERFEGGNELYWMRSTSYEVNEWVQFVDPTRTASTAAFIEYQSKRPQTRSVVRNTAQALDASDDTPPPPTTQPKAKKQLTPEEKEEQASLTLAAKRKQLHRKSKASRKHEPEYQGERVDPINWDLEVPDMEAVEKGRAREEKKRQRQRKKEFKSRAPRTPEEWLERRMWRGENPSNAFQESKRQQLALDKEDFIAERGSLDVTLPIKERFKPRKPSGLSQVLSVETD
ncbi:hypothetical protein VTL71DRAFT_8723 [Oculimacula yallundae]|uniref:Superoxide dismutase [Mn], mitochondrial n=1 Tax=Oculimacula yallundae TaxID=86028 RepID=A0ABR4CYE3_9HELO